MVVFLPWDRLLFRLYWRRRRFACDGDAIFVWLPLSATPS
jgi:hypothetical protein